MLGRLGQRICTALTGAGIIDPKDADIYLYGINQVLTIGVNIATTVLIGLCFGMVWESLLFLLVYIPLRTAAGGFHTSTPLRCYVASSALIVAVLAVLRWLPFRSVSSLIGLFAGCVVVWLFAPVADQNKPFTSLEKRCFRRRSRIILPAEVTFVFLFHALGMDTVAHCLMLSVVAVALMLLLGSIKNFVLENF
mgnify:CR=1 FL=1